MNLLTKAATRLGELKAAYDAPLLRSALQVDGLGRTLPMNFTGSGLRWLGGSWADKMRGQVWRVSNFFATTAAGVPFALYKPGPDGKAERVTTHPILDLLYQPNPDAGLFSFFYAVATQFKGCGNVFISRVKPEFGSGAGKPSELWILPPLQVKVRGGGPTTPIEGYRYWPDLTKPDSFVDLEREDVLHLKQYNADGSPYGLGCIVAAEKEITGDDSSIRAQVAQLQNMGPAGVLWFDAKDEAEAQMIQGSSAVPDMRRKLARTYKGVDAAGNIPVLTQKVGFTSLGTSAVDLDILNFRRANFADLCGYWGVPSLLLNDKEGTTYANLEAARKMLYTQAVVPYLSSLTFELSRWLCPQWDKTFWLEPDLSNIQELQADRATQAAWLSTAWWLKVKRKQEIMGEAPDWTGPEYMVPAGLVGSDALSLPPTEELQ